MSVEFACGVDKVSGTGLAVEKQHIIPAVLAEGSSGVFAFVFGFPSAAAIAGTSREPSPKASFNNAQLPLRALRLISKAFDGKRQR
jgi:hypothetical protein